jgi:uncharacterized membrane protein YqjE
MTGMAVLFAMLALLLVIWGLRRNTRDRESLEEELEDEQRADTGTPD